MEHDILYTGINPVLISFLFMAVMYVNARMLRPIHYSLMCLIVPKIQDGSPEQPFVRVHSTMSSSSCCRIIVLLPHPHHGLPVMLSSSRGALSPTRPWSARVTPPLVDSQRCPLTPPHAA